MRLVSETAAIVYARAQQVLHRAGAGWTVALAVRGAERRAADHCGVARRWTFFISRAAPTIRETAHAHLERALLGNNTLAGGVKLALRLKPASPPAHRHCDS